MSATATVSSGGAIVDVANFLKDYMSSMEQLPRSAQLLASQILDLDKNSHSTLSELEQLTESANFANASLPADMRRRLKRSLIELQTVGDEQHRLLGDVGEGIQRHTHRLQSQRKEAELHLRTLQVKGGSKTQEMEAPSSTRDPAPSKRKRVRESGPGGTPAKQSKRQPKDTSPGPSVAAAPANPRRTNASVGPRKTGTTLSVKKAAVAAPPSAVPAPSGSVPTPTVKKKKKKRKNVSVPEKMVEKVVPEKASEKGGKSGRRRQEGTGGDGASCTSGGVTEEPRYCLCGGVSSGPMVACDGPGCRVEWFHFECVGLTEAPKGNWYCGNCELNAPRPTRRAKAKGGGGGAVSTGGAGTR